MRSILTVTLLVASLFVAAPVAAQIEPAASISPPLPGLTEGLDRSLWCATMASTIARKALLAGDRQTLEMMGPFALALSRQVATHFVAAHFPKPDIESYIDLYETEITAVLAGTSPQRYGPDECHAIVVQQLVA
jgi:hypothetical protein